MSLHSASSKNHYNIHIYTANAGLHYFIYSWNDLLSFSVTQISLLKKANPHPNHRSSCYSVAYRKIVYMEVSAPTARHDHIHTSLKLNNVHRLSFFFLADKPTKIENRTVKRVWDSTQNKIRQRRRAYSKLQSVYQARWLIMLMHWATFSLGRQWKYCPFSFNR